MRSNNNFNLLRLIAALTVMFTHSYAMVGSGLRFERDVTIHWGTGVGGLAVHVFFIISGYLITQSYVRSKDLKKYLAHRALRLLPGLLVALALSQWAWIRYNGYEGVPLKIFNAPLWTLGWEALCYLAVGLLGTLGTLNRRDFNVIFAGLVFYHVFCAGDPSLDKRLEPMCMFFAMGAFIFINEESIKMSRAAVYGLIATFCAFATFIVFPFMHLVQLLTYLPPISERLVHYSLYIFGAPFLVIYVGKYAKTLIDIRTDISYGVYIYAWPIGSIIVYETEKRGIHFNGFHVFAYSLAPVLLISLLSCKLIEQPALKLKSTLFRRGKSMESKSSKLEMQ